MFERFTDRARRVVVLAQEEARLLNHDYIGTEHLLLALSSEGAGIAAQVLHGAGVELDSLRRDVEEVVGHGHAAPTGQVPFTPRAKKVLELALREALQLGHNYIGTEHILLGLLREGQGAACQVLHRAGLATDAVRERVLASLESPAGVRRQRWRRRGGVVSPALDAALARAAEEAARRGHDVVEAEHLLLALLDQEPSSLARYLREQGVDVEALRARVERALGGHEEDG